MYGTQRCHIARLRPPFMNVGVALQSKKENEIGAKAGRVMQSVGER